MEAILLYIVEDKYEILCNICKFHTFCIAFSFKLNLPFPPNLVHNKLKVQNQ